MYENVNYRIINEDLIFVKTVCLQLGQTTKVALQVREKKKKKKRE